MSTILKEDVDGRRSRLLQENKATARKQTRLSKVAGLNGQWKMEERWLRTRTRREGRKVEKSSPDSFLLRKRDNLIPWPSELLSKESSLMSSIEKSRSTGTPVNSTF